MQLGTRSLLSLDKIIFFYVSFTNNKLKTKTEFYDLLIESNKKVYPTAGTSTKIGAIMYPEKVE